MMNNSPSATKRSSEQSRVALDGKVQFHLFGSPCIKISCRAQRSCCLKEFEMPHIRGVPRIEAERPSEVFAAIAR
jgi:hypothetical protein